MEALDAGKEMQRIVDIAIPDFVLDGIIIERKTALSYIYFSEEGKTDFYIKLHCFLDKDQNCYHVWIEKESNGVLKYLTKTGPKMVRDPVEKF